MQEIKGEERDHSRGEEWQINRILGKRDVFGWINIGHMPRINHKEYSTGEK